MPGSVIGAVVAKAIIGPAMTFWAVLGRAVIPRCVESRIAGKRPEQ